MTMSGNLADRMELASVTTIQEQFRRSLLAPYENLDRSRPAIGYVCSYVPEEIIHAAGLVPVRVMPDPEPAFGADAWLPGFCCAVARGCLARSLNAKLDGLWGIAFASTCDTVQCLSDVWGLARPRDRILILRSPTRLDGDQARAYLVRELGGFADAVASLAGSTVSSEDLSASIKLYNRKRELMRRMEGLRCCMSASEYHAVMTAGLVLPVEDYIADLEHLSGTVSDPAAQSAGGVPVVVSGALLEDTSIHELLEELGGRVVGDDLCNGSRYYDTQASEGIDPLEALADRYLRRAHCPCKYAPTQSRAGRLLDLVRRTGAHGVVFALHKFCEPHAFDYPHLSRALRSEGVPSLLLELERTASQGQLRTRLQAFLETIGQN